MKTQRIILDENFSDGLSIALRKLGPDVISVKNFQDSTDKYNHSCGKEWSEGRRNRSIYF